MVNLFSNTATGNHASRQRKLSDTTSNIQVRNECSHKREKPKTFFFPVIEQTKSVNKKKFSFYFIFNLKSKHIQNEAISASQNSSSRGLLQKTKRKTKKSPDFSSSASMNNIDDKAKKTKICCLL